MLKVVEIWHRKLAIGILLGLAWPALARGVGAAVDYNPLAVDPHFQARQVDLVVHDAARSRDVPVLFYLPTNAAPAPVVLFSHGLGGERHGSRFLGEHWAARGYVAVFIQHPGSDDSVWKATPRADRFSALERAASLKNFFLRVGDVPAVLDQLSRCNTDALSPLHGRLDLAKVGMSGHSFGAVTTQAVSGEWFPIEGDKLTDSRIKAAVVFSPSTPKFGDAARAFGSVRIPWLLMTGTEDLSPIGEADMASRRGVYPALHGAPKYEVVLDKAEHSAFTDRPLPGDKEPRNPNHHRVILAVSTAFWDACLRGDPAALAWLNGSGPRSVMAAADTWQKAEH